MNEIGLFASWKLELLLGSLSQALLAADINASDQKLIMTDEALFDRIGDLAEEIGRSPSANELRNRG